MRARGSCEREEELLALGVAEALEDRVLEGRGLEGALLARDEQLVEQRQRGALVVDARGQHPAQHRAVEVQLLEAVAREGARARLLDERLERELHDVRQHAAHRRPVVRAAAQEGRAREGDLARKHALQ
eukprot:7377305-Prymnesium_polylepis.1